MHWQYDGFERGGPTWYLQHIQNNVLFTLDRIYLIIQNFYIFIIFLISKYHAKERIDRTIFVDIKDLHLRVLLDTHANHSLLQSFDLHTMLVCESVATQR